MPSRRSIPSQRAEPSYQVDDPESDGDGGSDYAGGGSDHSEHSAGNSRRKGKRPAGRPAPRARAPRPSAADEPPSANVRKAAAQLVRLALFSEYRKQKLPRDAISKAVGKLSINDFNKMFDLAQGMLRKTFGMELAELRPKRTDADLDMVGEMATQAAATQAAATQTQKRKEDRANAKRRRVEEGTSAEQMQDDDDEEEDEDEEEANGVGKAPAAKRTRVYVLRSILPAGVIEACTRTKELPLFNTTDQEYIKVLEEDEGAIIKPESDGTATGGVEMLGLRSVILCAILAYGRKVDERKLFLAFDRMGITKETVLPFLLSDNKDGKAQAPTLSRYLDILQRQNYLEKEKIPGARPGEEIIEWRWGARADTEFSEKAAGQFMEEMMFEAQPESESEDEDIEYDDVPQRNSRAIAARPKTRHVSRDEKVQRKREKLHKDLEAVAGGPLLGEL